MKSEIGECVNVLHHKIWGKTLVNGNKIKSQSWWRQRLDLLLKSPDVVSVELWESKAVDNVVPFEIEIGYPNLDYDTLFLAWQKRSEKLI